MNNIWLSEFSKEHAVLASTEHVDGTGFRSCGVAIVFSSDTSAIAVRGMGSNSMETR